MEKHTNKLYLTNNSIGIWENERFSSGINVDKIRRKKESCFLFCYHVFAPYSLQLMGEKKIK